MSYIRDHTRHLAEGGRASHMGNGKETLFVVGVGGWGGGCDGRGTAGGVYSCGRRLIATGTLRSNRDYFRRRPLLLLSLQSEWKGTGDYITTLLVLNCVIFNYNFFVPAITFIFELVVPFQLLLICSGSGRGYGSVGGHILV